MNSRFECCRHCIATCEYAEKGHVQTCPESCRQGSKPFKREEEA